MQLAPAKSYDAKYAKWDMSVFPCIPQQFKLAAKSETVACARLVRSFLKQADWVINATDPDREGELIFSYVYQACGCHALVMRVWIEDLTDAKIQKAFSNPIAPDQPISPQNPGTPNDLQAAGRVRDIADWLIGNNLTVAATKKFGGNEELLSVGRVQTPTLSLVVEREKAIRDFVKEPFWKLIADFTTPTDEHFEAEYSGGNFNRQEDAQKFLMQCRNYPSTVKELETKRRTQVVPLLYNVTQLQIAANKKFGWNADKISKIMRSLYEKKLMTYPRTSSEHLTAAMMPETAQTITKLLQMSEYQALSLPKNQWQKFTKHHFDDSKVVSHPAIIPTVNVSANMNGLSSDEKALYDEHLFLRTTTDGRYYPDASESRAFGTDQGFKAKSGKKFSAYLVLNRENGDITFDFTSEAEKKLQRPFCYSSMEKSRYSYLCTNTECGFKAPTEICKKHLTAAQITALLTKGRTGVIKGFKSKAGKSFSAILYIDQADRTVKFEFQNHKS